MIIPLNTQKSMSRWILKKFKKMGEEVAILALGSSELDWR